MENHELGQRESEGLADRRRSGRRVDTRSRFSTQPCLLVNKIRTRGGEREELCRRIAVGRTDIEPIPYLK